MRTSRLIRLVMGRPFEDANVWAYANTDLSGAFSIDQIPDGEYLVSVFYCYIWECVQQWWPGIENPDLAEAVVVADGQSNPSVLDFALPISLGDASISGHVNDLDGQPLVGARVQAIPYDNVTPTGDPDYWGNQLYTTTDSMGLYRFDYLPAGTFVVLTNYWEHGGYAEQWYDGASSVANATPIILENGDVRSDIDFSMEVIQYFGSVAGQVAFEDGQAIERAYIEAVSYYEDHDRAIWWPYEQYAISDENGAFLIEDLYEGEYQLNIYAQNAEGLIDDATGRNTLHVKVVGGEVTEVSASMRRQEAGSAEITGMVTGDQGEILEIAVVQAMSVTDFGAPYYTAITDADGAFQLESLPEGQYYIQTRAPWHLTEYYDDAFDPADAQLVDATVTGPAIALTIELSPTLHFRRRVG